jgi:Transcriptional regulator, AbiEi antitoxin/Protein of unknown function (DUF559)
VRDGSHGGNEGATGPERDIARGAFGTCDLWACEEPKGNTLGLERGAGDVRAPTHAREHPDTVCSRLASRQAGAVKRAQLLDAGVGPNAIKRRARTGQLHRRHRGVYIVGHTALAPRAEEFAALLACGDRALISHRSAAYLWSLIKPRPAGIDVTLVGRRRRPKDGIRLHFVAELDDRDFDRIDDLPLTGAARTVIDLAADPATETDELEAAISEARALKLIRDGDLERALGRAGPRKGVGRIRALLKAEGDNGYTRSKAERIMRRLMRAGGLRQPLCNRRLHGYNVDFLWPEERLVVEVDGYQFHGHRSAFERDRRKDQVLTAAGYRGYPHHLAAAHTAADQGGRSDRGRARPGAARVSPVAIVRRRDRH